jgi:rRNA processing protein Krr1/Pno1
VGVCRACTHRLFTLGDNMTAQEARKIVDEVLRGRPELELKYFLKDVKSCSEIGQNYTYLQGHIYIQIENEIKNLGYKVEQDPQTLNFLISW